MHYSDISQIEYRLRRHVGCQSPEEHPVFSSSKYNFCLQQIYLLNVDSGPVWLTKLFEYFLSGTQHSLSLSLFDHTHPPALLPHIHTPFDFFLVGFNSFMAFTYLSLIIVCYLSTPRRVFADIISSFFFVCNDVVLVLFFSSLSVLCSFLNVQINNLYLGFSVHCLGIVFC